MYTTYSKDNMILMPLKVKVFHRTYESCKITL